jgi:hypothetical protein
MQMIRLIFHLFRALNTLNGKHPVKFTLFYLCLLFFIGVEVWFNFAAPPARNWISQNLLKIQIDDPNHFSFAVFGDNKNSHSIFPLLLRKANQDHEIKFALDLGDLVFGGDMEKYRYFMKQVRGNFRKPFLTAIGNHELREEGRGLYYDLFGPFYYSFHAGKAYFIMLDDANEKGLDALQTIWLERELEQAQGYASRFVFMHVPLFDPRGEGYHHCLPEKQAQPLLELFKHYHVSRVFAGHIHGYYQGQWQGLPYTITGGAGAELVGRDPEHDFFNYTKVNVNGNSTGVTVQPIVSPEYEWLDRFGSMTWLYVFTFFRFHGIQLALILAMVYLLGTALEKKS